MPHRDPEAARAYQRAYRERRKEHRRAICRAWVENHREHRRDYQREYMRRWRAADPERARRQVRASAARFRLNHAVTAQPKPAPLPEYGLWVTSGPWQRVSGWEEDAEQDRVLAELERAAAQRRAVQ